MNVTLSAAQTATAFQTDIKFGSLLSTQPESVLSGAIISESHIVKAGLTKDGIRILAYSPTQEPLISRTGVAFSFVLDADSTFSTSADFVLSNIRVAAADGSYAQINDASYTATFAKTYVSSIVFPENDVTIIQGNQVKLMPTVLPVLATNKELSWATSDASIASVDQQGNVVSGNLGDAVITATATDGSRISGSVNVHVTEDPEVGILSLQDLPADAEVYDLAGRNLNSKFKIQNSKLSKGVYIINGKKVLVK
jgi:uncharacterized protein YjdB